MTRSMTLGRNPVLRRELLERWRGRRAFVVITGYLGVLGIITVLLTWLGLNLLDNQFGFQGGVAGSGPLLGRFLVENLLAFTLGLALLLAPAYAATQISGERERKTLALLRITLVKPGQIVLGKLGASVAWLLLLIVAAMPLMALGFFLGGITIAQILRGLFTIMAIAISVAAIGIGLSSIVKRSSSALVVTLLVVGALSLGTLFTGLIEGVARELQFTGGRPVSVIVNPWVAVADAVDADDGALFFGSRLESVLTAFGALLPQDRERFFGEPEIMFDEAFAEPGFGQDVFMERPDLVNVDNQPTDVPYWLIVSGLYLAVGAIFLVIASRRVAKEDIE